MNKIDEKYILKSKYEKNSRKLFSTFFVMLHVDGDLEELLVNFHIMKIDKVRRQKNSDTAEDVQLIAYILLCSQYHILEKELPIFIQLRN